MPAGVMNNWAPPMGFPVSASWTYPSRAPLPPRKSGSGSGKVAGMALSVPGLMIDKKLNQGF
jgi:hypothetical protein